MTRIRLLVVVVIALLTWGIAHAQSDPAMQDGRAPTAISWQVPALAGDEKSPLAVTADVLATGKTLYAQHCQRCHGTGGRGDGPDGDSREATADLTDGARTGINPDGVVFYKIWYGRFRPLMPAFGAGAMTGRQDKPGTLSRNDVWAVVAYVQSLRKPQ